VDHAHQQSHRKDKGTADVLRLPLPWSKTVGALCCAERAVATRKAANSLRFRVRRDCREIQGRAQVRSDHPANRSPLVAGAPEGRMQRAKPAIGRRGSTGLGISAMFEPPSTNARNRRTSRELIAIVAECFDQPNVHHSRSGLADAGRFEAPVEMLPAGLLAQRDRLPAVPSPRRCFARPPPSSSSAHDEPGTARRSRGPPGRHCDDAARIDGIAEVEGNEGRFAIARAMNRSRGVVTADRSRVGLPKAKFPHRFML
jgi:hypothetical protein